MKGLTPLFSTGSFPFPPSFQPLFSNKRAEIRRAQRADSQWRTRPTFAFFRSLVRTFRGKQSRWSRTGQILWNQIPSHLLRRIPTKQGGKMEGAIKRNGGRRWKVKERMVHSNCQGDSKCWWPPNTDSCTKVADQTWVRAHYCAPTEFWWGFCLFFCFVFRSHMQQNTAAS